MINIIVTNTVMISILFMFKKLFKLKLCFILIITAFSIVFCVLQINYSKLSKSETVAEIWNYSTDILWWKFGIPETSQTRACSTGVQCTIHSYGSLKTLDSIGAFLFYGSSIKFDKLPLPRLPHHIWGLYHEESPRNVEELIHEDILNLFNFSSTFSRYSDVPFPLQYLGSLNEITSTDYYVPTITKNEFLTELAPVLYLQSDCETSTKRDDYVRELMKFTKVDSYGACLNNKMLSEKFKEDYLNKLNDDDFLKFVSRYKFVIAIENGVCNDYVTEKFWRAIKVGTVPIYYGSPDIKDWIPNPKSALILDDYPTPELMSQQISKLMGNDDLYEEFLEHKIKQVITNNRLIQELHSRPYQTDTLQTIEHFECFVCQKLHNAKKGDKSISIVHKKHYDCPKPMTALSLSVDPSNDWLLSWESAKRKASNIIKEIKETNQKL